MMKVSEAIEELKKLNQDDDVIIAWWDNNAWPDVSKDKWPGLCDEVEYSNGWYENLTVVVEEFIEKEYEI